MTIEKYQDFMPYRFVSSTPVTLNNGDPSQVINSFSANVIPGDYEIKISIVADYQAQNDKFHYKLTGSFPSPEIVKESKDNAEVLAFTYAFPVTWAGGQMDIDLNAFAVGGDVLVEATHIMIQRVA